MATLQTGLFSILLKIKKKFKREVSRFRMLAKALAKDSKCVHFLRKACFWPILAFGRFLESRKGIKEEDAFFVEDKACRSRQHQGEDKINISERESESVSESEI